ncbi:uncharacterized protein LACBIDRAFT_335440 [Laccaria bicolor S238N-H82]|uniref:Predicted protein n=1 Tax=Laccaria bicolor (strain S238N-H82 / ATCC MYA-4686) TaxID=486041 RepID=B0E2C3_LACBS|nr:uncharacterized protein LACBIDRAFT_335440 [Laccaria bicolor S238N-H82]EDQ99004.1 predicted protein [Laccaria bicolor S238N-H82]|eukprot:XP_001890341.1 predicted protein [Laccaria bicolor S238N-H82]
MFTSRGPVTVKLRLHHREHFGQGFLEIRLKEASTLFVAEAVSSDDKFDTHEQLKSPFHQSMGYFEEPHVGVKFLDANPGLCGPIFEVSQRCCAVAQRVVFKCRYICSVESSSWPLSWLECQCIPRTPTFSCLLAKPTVTALLRDSLRPNRFQQRRVASYLPISTSPLPILAAELHYVLVPLAVFLD